METVLSYLIVALGRPLTAPPQMSNEKRSASEAGLTFENDEEDDRKPVRKIKIEYIGDKSKRNITFSKRKSGIMKKAYELSTLTGTQVLLLVASETGHVYTYATSKLQPLITEKAGKELIQSCLHSAEGTAPNVPTRPLTPSAPAFNYQANPAPVLPSSALSTFMGSLPPREDVYSNPSQFEYNSAGLPLSPPAIYSYPPASYQSLMDPSL